MVGLNDKHLHQLLSVAYKDENSGRQRAVTLTWSGSDGYRRATADHDGVSAWSGASLTANTAGWSFMAIGSSPLATSTRLRKHSMPLSCASRRASLPDY